MKFSLDREYFNRSAYQPPSPSRDQRAVVRVGSGRLTSVGGRAVGVGESAAGGRVLVRTTARGKKRICPAMIDLASSRQLAVMIASIEPPLATASAESVSPR